MNKTFKLTHFAVILLHYAVFSSLLFTLYFCELLSSDIAHIASLLQRSHVTIFSFSNNEHLSFANQAIKSYAEFDTVRNISIVQLEGNRFMTSKEDSPQISIVRLQYPRGFSKRNIFQWIFSVQNNSPLGGNTWKKFSVCIRCCKHLKRWILTEKTTSEQREAPNTSKYDANERFFFFVRIFCTINIVHYKHYKCRYSCILCINLRSYCQHLCSPFLITFILKWISQGIRFDSICETVAQCVPSCSFRYLCSHDPMFTEMRKNASLYWIKWVISNVSVDSTHFKARNSRTVEKCPNELNKVKG